ncbi:LysR family transcriptional regulator [Pseudoduganella umbonata]|uniref:DNA-binding transcriptional LysR family regulator n=1 Tax=Pseudoduganella umbonata TaxID=864828 RepID=A0A4P8HIV7_9BURK|nr:LysR family transcriptional regulator [Pseudoduganella umbonata]MBB3219546.1 DNA-binding transcriptional LysR family regulator [Pseudoduganella umbonata]QCP09619.1 LysR family transcriptional regulator [Pseudoduganella umbonata]
MRREEMADLTVFLAVAEARSFTRAAARLGLSQSALSQIVRRLEERLGVRLLTRTTRSVAPTEAGERLIDTLAPALDQLDASLAALSELGGKPTGTIRITSVEHATKTVLWPVLQGFLAQYPDVKVAVTSDYGLVDIVAERFDAGVRMGEHVDKDMIAVRIAPDFRAAIVGSPAYFQARSRPKVPQDLVTHQCINLSLSTSRGHYIWHFKKGRRELKARVDGCLAFNSIGMLKDAALAGFGLAYLPEDEVAGCLAAGSLLRVLEDWCPLFPGYHLYYPSRRQQTPAFSLLVEALKANAR